MARYFFVIYKRRKSFFDRKIKLYHYESKDLVMLKTMSFKPFLLKLQDRCDGPYAIIDILISQGVGKLNYYKIFILASPFSPM